MKKTDGNNEKIKKDYRLPDMLINLMMHLNFWMLLFILFIMYHALWGYVQEGSALSFLMNSRYIPERPFESILSAGLLYACLILLLTTETDPGIHFLLKLLAETIIVIVLSRIMSFCYMGMFLMIIANLIRRPIDRWNRNIIFVLVGLCYFLLESQILSVWIPVTSLSDYLNYYRSDYSKIFQGIINVGRLMNVFLFMCYMFFMVRIQMSENERILSLNEQLRDANAKLEEYSEKSALMAQTSERNRLAREIHDTIGHSLTGIVTGIEACIMLFDTNRDLVKEQLIAISEVAHRGMEDVRRSVRALKPDGLESMPLDLAIEQMIDEMRRSTGIRFHYNCSVKLRNTFGEDEGEALYRTVQEGITNSVRHGKPEDIWILINKIEDKINIIIRDNGSGCPDLTKGFGLSHMEERLEMLDGKLFCDGKNGFLLHAEIPIRWGTEVSWSDDQNIDS
ncbi:sensor histidine kinase [Butyrivibrio sp. AC2005]|uniref:sensor histidine kinase n=1 Tax=Butyrivibrio sp. AC2005 TaxID=1280672 RepID=UPI000403E9BC|nr:sensor histidine kinase [Butyrivibrio sp. AC2005]